MKKILLRLFGIVVFIIVFLIGGFHLVSYTANRPHFVTQELPVAHLNQPYYAKIEIGAAIASFKAITTSDDIIVTPRVYVDFIDNDGNPVYVNDYSDLTITGTPTTLAPITIKLTGATYGTMFVGKWFEKEYVIEVLDK